MQGAFIPLGALPGLWSLEVAHRKGALFDRWRLLPLLPEARTWYSRAGARSIQALATDAGEDARQASIFAAPDAPLEQVDARAVGLAILLLRAGRRASPSRAAAELVERYAEVALGYAPAQVGMFGGGATDEGDPAAVLAELLKFRLPDRLKPNPGGGRAMRWQELGRNVTLDVEMPDGAVIEFDIEHTWRLCSDSGWRALYLVRVGRLVPVAEGATPRVAERWQAWACVDAPDAAWTGTAANGRPRQTIGRIVRIYYDGRLAGDRCRRVHAFRRPFPQLTDGPDGPTIARGGSGYTVTARGIVG